MTKGKDGRYRTKVVIGHDSSGKPITKWATGKTKRELEEAKNELRKYYITGDSDKKINTMFGVYAKEWYEAYKKPRLSISSQQSYASIFNVHILPQFSNRQLRSITGRELQLFINSKSDLGSTSIGYIVTILRGIFKTALAAGLIERDPTAAITKPQIKKQSKRALTDAETEAVLFVGENHPEGLLLLMLYYTGLRIGEALGLQWRDIDFQKQTISVVRDVDYAANGIGGLKTENSKRIVPMPEELSIKLSSLRGIGQYYVFPSPQTNSWLPKSTFVRRWTNLMAALYEYNGTIENKTVNGRTISILTPHYFRHNYASVLYNAGVDMLSAQKFLGHSDVKTTLAIYSHLAESTQELNADKVRSTFGKRSRSPENSIQGAKK